MIFFPVCTVLFGAPQQNEVIRCCIHAARVIYEFTVNGFKLCGGSQWLQQKTHFSCFSIRQFKKLVTDALL